MAGLSPPFFVISMYAVQCAGGLSCMLHIFSFLFLSIAARACACDCRLAEWVGDSYDGYLSTLLVLCRSRRQGSSLAEPAIARPVYRRSQPTTATLRLGSFLSSCFLASAPRLLLLLLLLFPPLKTELPPHRTAPHRTAPHRELPLRPTSQHHHPGAKTCCAHSSAATAPTARLQLAFALALALAQPVW